MGTFILFFYLISISSCSSMEKEATIPVSSLLCLYPLTAYTEKRTERRLRQLEEVTTHYKKTIIGEEWYKPAKHYLSQLEAIVHSNSNLASRLGFPCDSNTPTRDDLEYYQVYYEVLTNALIFIPLWQRCKELAQPLTERLRKFIEVYPREFHIASINFADQQPTVRPGHPITILTSEVGDIALNPDCFSERKQRKLLREKVVRGEALLRGVEAICWWLHITNPSQTPEKNLTDWIVRSEQLPSDLTSTPEVHDMANHLLAHYGIDDFYNKYLIEVANYYAGAMRKISENKYYKLLSNYIAKKTSLHSPIEAALMHAQQSPLNDILIPAFGAIQFFCSSLLLQDYQEKKWIEKSVPKVINECALIQSITDLFLLEKISTLYDTLYSHLLMEQRRIKIILNIHKIPTPSLEVISSQEESAQQKWLMAQHQAEAHLYETFNRESSKKTKQATIPIGNSLASFRYNKKCEEYIIIDTKTADFLKLYFPQASWVALSRTLDKYLAEGPFFNVPDKRVKIGMFAIQLPGEIMQRFLLGLKLDARGDCIGRYISIPTNTFNYSNLYKIITQKNALNNYTYTKIIINPHCSTSNPIVKEGPETFFCKYFEAEVSEFIFFNSLTSRRSQRDKSIAS
jgi:hypothetical protein